MPLCDFFLQHLINQFMLFDHCQALELGRLDLDSVHGSATAADVLDLESVSACRLHNMLRINTDATVGGVA